MATRPRSGELNVQPGSEVHRSIVCPKLRREPVAVLIKCDWPADLEKERLVLYAPFALRGRDPRARHPMDTLRYGCSPGRREDKGIPGEAMMNQPGSFPVARSVLCGPGMTLTEILHFERSPDLDPRTAEIWQINCRRLRNWDQVTGQTCLWRIFET